MKKSVFLRLFTMLLAFAILLCLTACQSGENPGDTESYDSSIDPSIFLNTEDETTVSQKSEYVQKEFHISTFQGLAPVEEVTDMTPEYYTNAAKAHKEAGFTLIENAFLNRQAGLIAARACESAKIHFLHQNITYDMGFSGVGSSTPGVYEDTVEAVVQEMKDYKYLEGYYTWDEVDKTTLELCKNVNDLFTKHDSKRLPFAITYPSYGRYRWDNQNDPDESSFARYVRSFDETVNPPVLCFDYYPFQMHGGENTDLMVCDVWRDIGLFRSLSLETGKPFWFYFQGYNMGTHTPSHNYYFSNEMRSVQMYYAIAYGAKSVSYFITAGGVLVDEYGNKSAEFEDIKKLNQ